MAVLSRKEKLAYGLGDFGANFVFQSELAFLLFFYTDVFRIPAATAGTIMFIARVIDALSAPVIGAIADRTDSRWGKYRPWILWTAVPLAAAFVLCFTTPPLSQTGKLVWAIVTCNLLMIVYAANNIPYCALAGVMTDNASERTSLVTWRFVCAMSAIFIVNTFTVDLVRGIGGDNTALGYQAVMGVWGAVAAICFALTFQGTRERISIESRSRVPLRQDILDLLHSTPWITLFAMAVLINVQLAFRGSAMLYYFTHFLHREDLFKWFNGMGLTVTMVGIMLANPLAARLGKRAAFRGCLLLSAVLLTSFALLTPQSLVVLFTLQALFQLTFGPTIPLLWAMMADVADHLEWQTGRRSTALAFASIVFGMKLGLGIASWISGEWLEFMGYSQEGAQSMEAVRGTVLLVSIFPAAALVMGFMTMFVYPIDERVERQMREGLRMRRDTRI